MADGVEDGNLSPVLAGRVSHERRRLQGVLEAQDRIADRVTGLAGSLKFVYIRLLTMIVSVEAIFLSQLTGPPATGHAL